MREELLKGLTDEQIKKVLDCKDPKEILAIAKEEGVELNDEQLEAVSGGYCLDDADVTKCKMCGSEDLLLVEKELNPRSNLIYRRRRCKNCGADLITLSKD